MSPENTARVPAYSTMDGRMFLTGDDLGSRLLVDVAEGVQLLKAMVSEDSAEDLREVECEAIVLNHNRREHDIVDVRIRFPNGEDYIVLSKKELYRLEDEVKDRCYLQCAEEEIALLSGAYVDAWIYQGARLYTARYVQPALQEQAVVTYVPSADAIEAMSRNPNIKEKAVRELMLRNRSSLEERLAVSEVSGKTVSSWEDAALEGGNVGGYDEISDWEE